MSTSRTCLLLICLLLVACTASGQVRSSSIIGTVTDPSGAVVPGAAIIVTNEETNVAAEIKTNGVGEYTAPYLGAGRYAVQVTASGFQTVRKTGIVIGTGTILRVDVSLLAGSVSTAIDVKADAVILQTDNATVQGSVSHNLIANIPNINNNPLYYASLQAGVVGDPKMFNSNVLGVGYADRQAMSSIRVNGGQVGTNDVQLDGLSVQGAAWHETAVVPDRDALQEVRVTTNSFSAEMGNAQGVISMITKSGTNQFHGTLTYRLRNEALNANGLSNNQQGIARGKYRLNEGGGTIGGPVVLPKLFNGRDKLFFFASFSRLTHSDPVALLTRVPTLLERKGDFSQTMVADSSGKPAPVQLFNPFTAQPYQGSTQVFQRQPYPNSIITNPDPFGLKILQAYPQPNNPPTDAFNNNNYSFTGSAPTVRNNLATRLDIRPNQTHFVYLTGGFSTGSITQPNKWGDSPFVNMTSPGLSDDNNPYAAAGDTIALTPSTVIDVRYGVTRIRTNSSYPVTTGFDYSSYGMPANVQSMVALSGTAATIRSFGGPIAELNNDRFMRKAEAQTNHVLAGSVTHTRGKWTFKNGGDFRVYLGNWRDLTYATPALNAGVSTGQFSTISGANSSLITNPVQGGIPFASALTGVAGWDLPAGSSAQPALAAKYFALYSQNDWKATAKLTVNLGLRYEVQPGPTERYNHISSLDLNRANPYTAGLSSPNAKAGLGFIAFPGTESYARNLWDTQWNNVSPRVGAAYRLTPTMVLRGGFGRTFVPSNTGFNATTTLYGTAPFSGGVQSIPYGLTPNGTPIGRFEDANTAIVTVAKGAVQSPNMYGIANSTDLFPRNYRNGTYDQWNFFVERSFGRAWVLAAGYTGSHGFDLQWRSYPLAGNWDIPPATLQSWRSTWLASSGLTDPATVQVPNPIPALVGQATGSIGSATISTIDSMKPYLALLGQTSSRNLGDSNYHALQVRAEHAYSNGFQVLFNYTWSKATGLFGGPSGSNFGESQAKGLGSGPSGGVDYFNINNNHGLLSYDVTHRAVGVLSYELPTNKGQRLDPGNKYARAIVGGWLVSTVITLQSGLPWGPNCGGLSGRCNILTDQPIELPESLQHWYDGKTAVTLPDGRIITPARNTFLKWNPDRYAAPVVQFPNGKYSVDQYWYGASAMYPAGLRTPSFQNVNLSIQRQIWITEGVRLELNADATNLFNATNFYPNAVTGGGGAVTAAAAATNTQVGQNSNIQTGSLSLSLYQPRQIQIAVRLRF